MINPRRVNRESRGLLDLFRAKVGGRQPDTFSDQIQTTVDQLPFIAGPLIVAEQDSASTVNTGMIIRVPQSEAWLITVASAQVGPVQRTTDGYAYAALGIDLPNADGGAAVSMHVAADHFEWNGAQAAARQYVVASWTPGSPFIAQPDTVFRITGEASATQAWKITVAYAPLKI